MDQHATYDDVKLILQLYEMRREEKLREARQWFAKFNARTWASQERALPARLRSGCLFPHGDHLLGNGGVLHHLGSPASGTVPAKRSASCCSCGKKSATSCPSGERLMRQSEDPGERGDDFQIRDRLHEPGESQSLRSLLDPGPRNVAAISHRFALINRPDKPRLLPSDTASRRCEKLRGARPPARDRYTASAHESHGR